MITNLLPPQVFAIPKTDQVVSHPTERPLQVIVQAKTMKKKRIWPKIGEGPERKIEENRPDPWRFLDDF